MTRVNSLIIYSLLVFCSCAIFLSTLVESQMSYGIPLQSTSATPGLQYNINGNQTLVYSSVSSTNIGLSLEFSKPTTSTASTSIVTSKRDKSSYKYYSIPSSYTLLDVFSISFTNAASLSDFSLKLSYTYSSGLLNTDPSTVVIFYQASSSQAFTRTNSVATNVDAKVLFNSISNVVVGSNLLIGIASVAQTTSGSIGSIYNLYGPRTLSYTLNNYDSLVVNLPNVQSTSNPGTLQISKQYSASQYYTSNGYATLYSFKNIFTGSPNILGNSYTYNIGFSSSYTDYNGNSVTIQKNTFRCVCSSSSSSYSEISYYYNGNSALSCYIPNLSSCNFFAIIAKTQAGASSSSDSGSATSISNYEYVSTGTISTTKYYKISVGPYQNLRLSSIHLLSYNSGFATVKINPNSKPSTYNYDSYETIQYSSSYTNMIYYNTNSWTKTVYISVEPTSSATSVAFTAYLEDQDYYNGGYPIVLFVFGGVFTLFSIGAVIAVITVIKRNSRPSPHHQQL